MSSAFYWIHEVLVELENQGSPVVYLRNYEGLPDDLGNDVDLLVSEAGLASAIGLAMEKAKQHGWRHIKTVEFGPHSMFFCSEDGGQFVHIDWFTELAWHWIPFADAKQIISRRRFSGIVFTPHPHDELFLNIVTRLLYHGIIRDKHREQANSILTAGDADSFRESVVGHVGCEAANMIIDYTINHKWDALEGNFKTLRKLVVLHTFATHSGGAMRAGFRYIRRAIHRILHPPGPFFAFVGGDDARVRTLLDDLSGFFKGITGRIDTLIISSKELSSPLTYLRRIFPARIKNRAVVLHVESPSSEGKIDFCALRLLPMPEVIIRLDENPHEATSKVISLYLQSVNDSKERRVGK